MQPTIERYTTNAGRRLYRLPLEVFPNFIGYAYLLVEDERTVLIDAGSVMPQSVDALREHVETVREEYGEPVSLETLSLVLITHGHIDHFSGLSVLQEEIRAPIIVHDLDIGILHDYRERLVMASKALAVFLQRAGVSEERRARLLEMYLSVKSLVTPIRGVRRLSEAGDLLGAITPIHAPGHCPGQVCLRIDDILISADHILPRTTPHLAPESITPYTGLGHYFAALETIQHAARDVRLVLGGHEEPLDDLVGRIEQIRRSHERKLERFYNLCSHPRTIAELSLEHYGKRQGYDIILALTEAGAHVEYLYQRGYLTLANVDDVEREPNPVLLYRRA
ncbi:hypothetical protein ARMA_1961 [Ardenticatena maritima]|uniref:Metallo-beta-lactamase domain-containing protein n=1 Tax=Ardenticatena maritima TaxID=872965 RepID=A0A0M9UD10_9CHLR|nr:MBL fold metallo-hydrolase [Ardenticatena maritima]KPL89063.1 hypothetical protein SE16_00455 [Ardenticatena maritima]GAP63538.1 hypothetical protein ARMA_1961 [Ardenticatena maritima]